MHSNLPQQRTKHSASISRLLSNCLNPASRLIHCLFQDKQVRNSTGTRVRFSFNLGQCLQVQRIVVNRIAEGLPLFGVIAGKIQDLPLASHTARHIM